MSVKTTPSPGDTNNASRTVDITVCVPLCYGSVAFALKKPKPEEYHTHQWTLYVRGPNNEDLSNCIAKVVFQLHPSFPQPVRELSAPPFEVTERGWGEFDATIRIVWRCPSEKAVVLTHGIKLYETIISGGANSRVSSGSQVADAKKNPPVIHEIYDEVVFTNPTKSFHHQLLHGPWSTASLSTAESKFISNRNGDRMIPPLVKSREAAVQQSFQTYSDEKDFRTLLSAGNFLERELADVKDRLTKAGLTKESLENKIAIAMATIPSPRGGIDGLGGGGRGGRLSVAGKKQKI